MGFKSIITKSILDTVMKIDPTLDKDEVEEIIHGIIKEKIKDPTIITDNNVTGENHRITLTQLCEWIGKRNPVVSGNATFYMQPKEKVALTSFMLRSLKKLRKSIKKEMFKLIDNPDMYAMKDLEQGNTKVIMNAEYGGSGTPTAAFYTKYSPPATTLMAQTIITIMAAFFEGFVGDNQKFFKVNECFEWMNKVIEKVDDKNLKVHKWIRRVTPEEVSNRIIDKFIKISVDDIEIIKRYINNRTENELIYLYYANNLNTFITHDNVKEIIYNILMKLPKYEAALSPDDIPSDLRNKFIDSNKPKDDYNKYISKEMFLDPYEVPEVIKDEIKKLQDLTKQYVYVEYMTPDSIIKLNNHERNTVLLVDTDSNILNADLFVSHVLENLFPAETFGREKMYNEMILVNVLASILDGRVADILDYYGRTHNMDEESRAELTMKNEFMFRRLFLMNVKKRYAASIVLREGNIIYPFKPEFKGVDFIKAGVTDELEARFRKMVESHILFSDDLELHELMKDVKDFEKEIYQDLCKGGTKYIKPQQYKAEGAYKALKDENGRVIGTTAWSLPVFRGVAIWNELYPDDRIYSLDRVKVVKLISKDIAVMEKIKDKYPNEYEMVMKKIYGNEKKEIRDAGMKVIAIPMNLKQIPDWIVELIDKEMIVSDAISSFKSILKALVLEEMPFKTPNGSASITSCLISL